MNSINWSRGFKRLWMVGSAIWMLYMLWNWLSWYHHSIIVAATYNTPTPPPNVWEMLALVVMPPLLVYVAARTNFFIGRWLIAGFRN